jgi:hypothetical protein
MPPFSHRSNSRNVFFSSLSVVKIWIYVSLLENLSLRAPNSEFTLIVAIKQGGTAEAVISGVIEMVDSTVNYSLFFIAKWFL